MAHHACPNGARLLHTLLCSATLAVACLPPAMGAETRSLLQVGAVVAPRIALAVDAPAQLIITEQDLRRGYVDVTEPTLVSLRSNAPRGLLLDLRAAGSLFSGIELREGGMTTRMPGDGGEITVRWPDSISQGTVALSLRWRFVLRPAVTAGRYAWPVQMAAQPL